MFLKKGVLVVAILGLGLTVGCHKDTEPPTVTITNPTDDATVQGIVTIEVTADDNEEVASVEIYIDDTFRYEDSESPFQYSWDTRPLEDSSYHTIIAKAYDGAENEGVDTVRVMVYIPVVRVSITNPADDAVVHGIEIIQVDAEGDEDIVKVELYIDDSLCYEDSDASCEYLWDTTPLADSSYHTIVARAYDAKDNEGADTVTVMVCNPTVSVSIIHPQDGAIIEDTVTVLVKSNSQKGIVVKCEFYVDDTLRRTCGVDTSFSGDFGYVWRRPAKVDGSWCTIVAKVYDEFNNVGADTIQVQLRTHIKWLYHTGNIGWYMGAVAVDGSGTIYTGDKEGTMWAFNPDGTVKWRYDFEYGFETPPSIGSSGTIYIASFDSLYAFDPNGSVRWSLDIYRGVRYLPPAIGADGTIYLATANYLYAIEPDGNIKWRRSGGDAPVIGSEGTIYVARDQSIYAVNPDSTLKWQCDLPDRPTSSLSLGKDGTVYVGCEAHVYAITPDYGTVKWSYPVEGRVNGSPIIGADETMYFGTQEGYLYALDPGGNMRWRYEFEYRRRFKGAAIASDETIYVLVAGCFYAIDTGGILIWSSKLEYATYGTPTIGPDGTVYVCDSQNLYAFEGSSPLVSSPWPMFQHDARHTGRAGGP